jgi:hypothetical protein
MKGFLQVVLLALPLALMAGEVKVGDNSEVVRSALGAPRGRTQVGTREIFYYDRGEVELNSGTVTRVAMRSEQEQLALEAKREADAQRFRVEQEMHFARMTSEGEALKAHKLSDPVFLATPAAYQVAFWQNFSRQYAGVPCEEQLGAAQARLADYQVQAQRVAELEARNAELEEQMQARNDTYYFPPLSYSPYYYNGSYFGGLNHRNHGHDGGIFCRNDSQKHAPPHHSTFVSNPALKPVQPFVKWDATQPIVGTMRKF